jgi:eukaryotic-like serine/threonine-protein kinase
MNSKATEAVFEATLALPPEQRAAYLDQACGTNGQLRQGVEALLQAHKEAGPFMVEPATPLPTQAVRSPIAPTEKSGDKIGHYRLLQEIGEGGCGVVYLAEQAEPIRRRVALKVIKLGMDTKQVIARFEAERQALALMDHPNIAKVLDAGATDTGRPYFVMELVRGIKLTDYCDQNNLSTEERLKLFAQVCRAIQHAHQKGIIHRDIKPSNILVTVNEGIPVPKVIDFGIAKATGGQLLTNKTLFTMVEQFMGTPAYMSPEQAEMTSLDIDTRSDIYALGVLLYELLTGHTPFDGETLLSAGLDGMRRIIREKEPPRPSTRLSTFEHAEQTTIASRRRTDPPKLIHQVRGDLDWIVMKCLEKDRTRRYETANGLAMDIERHLKHQPVSAAAPGTLYRAGRFVRRHKVGLAVAAAVALLLAVGTVISTWQAVRATRAERRARVEASKSQQVARFLRDMLGDVAPSAGLGRERGTPREMLLDQTAERVGKDLQDQPDVEAELRSTLGAVYYELGRYAKAEVMHRQALALRRKLFGPEHLEVASSLSGLDHALERQGRLVEAESVAREALAMRRHLLGDQDPTVARSLSRLAFLLQLQGELAEAEAMHRKAVTILRQVPGNEPLGLADALEDLAGALWRQGRFVEAEALFREGLSIEQKLLVKGHPSPAIVLDNLAAVLRDEGRLVEAESTEREALEIRKKVYGNEHPNVALSLNNLARIRRDQGKLNEAEAIHREALAMRRKLLGNGHPEVARSLNNLAYVLQDKGDLTGALSLHQEALAIQKKALGNAHPDVALSLNNLAVLLCTERKPAEAEALARESLAIREKLSPADWRTFNARSLLGDCLLQQKQYAAAEPLLLSGCEGLTQQQERIPAEHKPRLKEARERLVRLYEATGRPEKAAEWKKELRASAG